MVREILSVGVGQGGIQLSNAIWGQYITEHGINRDGTVQTKLDKSEDDGVQAFFESVAGNRYVPRTLIIDLEPTVVDDVRRGPMASMFNQEFMRNGQEDAANNFARGHYTVGKKMLDIANDRIRKLFESSSNVQGFIVSHSVGGGTGSGFGMLILERLAVDYRKKSKIGFEIYPSPNISTCIVEPYNGLLSTHWLLDHTDVSLVLDNEAIYEICQKRLDVPRPNYANLNRVIAKVVSSMTAAIRFTGELNVDMNEFQTNLVPFPRLHFMTTSTAPVISSKKKDTANIEVRALTVEALKKDSFLVKYANFDAKEDQYMAISLNYRGDVKSKESNSVMQWLKGNEKVSFVSWCPTGFKIGLNNEKVAAVPDDDMIECDKSVVMIGNNVAVNRVFSERLSKKYDMMYSQRAYVHWYVGEGMEEGEFSEAREDLEFLEKDYLDVVTEKASDEDEDGDAEY